MFPYRITCGKTRSAATLVGMREESTPLPYIRPCPRADAFVEKRLFALHGWIEYDMDSYVIQEDDNGIGWLYPQS
jgi:hypothetical protein